MEETIKSSFPWSTDAIKNGAILGIIHTFILLILYYAVPSKLTGFSYVALIIALNLGFSIYCSIQYRNELGGYIDFKNVFKYTFVLLAFNGLIGILFLLIFLFVEPAYPQVMAQSQLDTSVYWAQRFGAPENAIEKIHDEFNFEEVEKRFSFSGLLLSFGVGLLFYAIGAVITALVVRKSQPETI